MTEFISRNHGNVGFEIIIKTDSHEHYRATEDFARRLIDHAKPVTNADRIRAMSDEELVVFINTLNICDTRTNEECKFNYGADCSACVLNWLKQPAEAEDAVQD